MLKCCKSWMTSKVVSTSRGLLAHSLKYVVLILRWIEGNKDTALGPMSGDNDTRIFSAHSLTRSRQNLIPSEMKFWVSLTDKQLRPAKLLIRSTGSIEWRVKE